MPLMTLPVAGPFNKQRSLQFDNESAVNWYLMTDKVAQKSMLAPAPGTTPILTFDTEEGDAKGRASFQTGEFLYEVVGSTVFSVDSNDNQTAIGELTTNAGYVGICSNGLQILFVDGAKGWVYTILTESFDEITAVGFPSNPIDCAFQQSFFLVVQGNSNAFYQSASDDASLWDPENFARSNSDGDILVAIRSINNRLFLFSTNSTSVFEDQGKAGFAFRQDENILFNYGTYTRRSTQVAEGSLFFVGRNSAGTGSVYFSDGGEPRAISTLAIDTQLNLLSSLEDAEGIIFKENGQVFYQLSFTTANVTFLYNSNSDSWSTRCMLDRSRHIATSYAFFNNTSYILSYNDNKLYKMSQTILTDSGLPIYRERTLPPIMMPSNKNFFVKLIRGFFQSGVGLNGVPALPSINYVQGADPRVFISVSRDGGQTFGNQDGKPLGRIGEFFRRVIWYRKGRMSAKGALVLRFSIYDPVQTYFISAVMEYEEAFN